MDESKNIYKVSPYECEQILNYKIPETYNIIHSDNPALINKNTANFARKQQIVDRLGKIEEKWTYILFKDH